MLGYKDSNLDLTDQSRALLPIELYPIDLDGNLCHHAPAW